MANFDAAMKLNERIKNNGFSLATKLQESEFSAALRAAFATIQWSDELAYRVFRTAKELAPFVKGYREASDPAKLECIASHYESIAELINLAYTKPIQNYHISIFR